jgi:hypothetical protein
MAKKLQKRKEKIINCKLNRNFPKILDQFIELNIPLEVGIGKYSSYIKTVNDNTKYKFLTKMQSKKTFIGYVKILKDLKRPEVEVVLSDMKDNVKEKDNTYYNYGRCDTGIHKDAVCVDMNSAYLQALFNLTLITKTTKEYIENNLSKAERLVAVGMLAKRKEVLIFDKGKLIEEKYEDAKNRFIFNAIIQEVAGVMNEIRQDHIDDFIAYWVDGIYVTNEFIAIDILDQFQKAGFPCKIEYLKNFKSKLTLNYMQYTYSKEGKEKILQMPLKHVHDSRKRATLNVINSKRLSNNLGPITIDYLDEHTRGQAGLFD